MRLKTYTGDTMAEVMRSIRHELGDDAVIVSTIQQPGGAVRITAALEAPAPDDDAPQVNGQAMADENLEFIRRALDYHGVPPRTTAELVNGARMHDIDDPVVSLAAALDQMLHFSPLPEFNHRRPLMLVGPAGAGKTVSIAKLAARAALRGKRLRVISTDTLRAGGIGQLLSLTNVLGIETTVADSPSKLFIALADPDADGADLTLIDTRGINPFDPSEIERLQEFVDVSDAERVLVLPAGLEPRESGEVAGQFSALTPTRLLVTRLDATRRYGGIVTAAIGGNLMLCDAGTTPQIADGLSPLNPVGFARLLLRDPTRTDHPLPQAEADA